MDRKWSQVAGFVVGLGLVAPAFAEQFKVVRTIPAGAVAGKRTGGEPWTPYPFSAARPASASAAKIGDPAVLMLDTRLAAAESRRKAAEAKAAAEAAKSAAAQAAPAEPQGQAAEPELIIVRYPRPGYRAEAPWTYYPRSRDYTGTRPPRYYETQPPRYLEAQAFEYYRPAPARPWGYHEKLEAYSYDLRQLQGLQETVEARIENLKRTARE
jgi:hypothetical protein